MCVDSWGFITTGAMKKKKAGQKADTKGGRKLKGKRETAWRQEHSKGKPHTFGKTTPSLLLPISFFVSSLLIPLFHLFWALPPGAFVVMKEVPHYHA